MQMQYAADSPTVMLADYILAQKAADLPGWEAMAKKRRHRADADLL
jgi:hypothetical protein